MGSETSRVHRTATVNSCSSLLLLAVLTMTALYAASRSTKLSHNQVSLHVSRSRAVYAGSYGAAAVANLSDFKFGLVATVLDAFDHTKPQAEGFNRWDNLKPIISCPPDRPLVRYGDSADGGKLLCDVSRLPSPCVIYSLGSAGDYTFEQDMLKATQCEVHTFDCTFDGTSQDPSRHFYHKWCIGSSNATGFKTWDEATAALGHQQHRLAVLKVDIEGFESNVISELRHNRPLPEQISMEFHMVWRTGVAPKTRPQLTLLHMHLASLGYAIVGQEDNKWAGIQCCAEWSFLLVEQPTLPTTAGPK